MTSTPDTWDFRDRIFATKSRARESRELKVIFPYAQSAAATGVVSRKKRGYGASHVAFARVRKSHLAFGNRDFATFFSLSLSSPFARANRATKNV